MLEFYDQIPHHVTLYFNDWGMQEDDGDGGYLEELRTFRPEPGFSYDAVLALYQIYLYGPRLLELGFKLIHDGINPNSGNRCALYFKSEI